MKKRILSLLLLVSMLVSVLPIESLAVSTNYIYNYAVDSTITNIPKLATKEHTVNKVDNGDNTALGKTYTVNKDQITVDAVKNAGVAETKSGVHPAPDAIHMIIYANEGMAIDFIGGTDWTYAGSKPTADGDDIWFWSWESSVKANYVIVKNGTAGQQSKFTVTTTVDNKKYYCNVLLCVVEKSSPVKLENALPSSGLEGYTLKDVPVTLYNYDGKKFNEYYDNKGGNYFAFASTVKGVNTTENAGNRGWTESGLQANGGGGVALMGIVKDELDANGLPVMSQGQKVDVFSTNEVPGKQVYEDVNFQFVYNENTGYYTYNSALNHAQYNDDNKKIELYEQSLAPSDTPNGASHGNAGFYPFEDINNAYTNTGYTDISWNEWATKLEENAFELIPSEYSTDISLTNATDPESTVDLHYGIQVASDFYLPTEKKLNGKDMVYEFTGDDDLWVFIDGKLVLDIGGGHTYVSGSFNLTTGEVWVEKYTKLAAADGGSYSNREQGTDLRYTDPFLTSLEADKMHTIQIFYLERHAGVSNCRMRFNLPLVPSDSVHVGKDLYNENGKALSVTPDVDYEFALYTAEDDDDNIDAADTAFTPLANAKYTVSGPNAPTSDQTTDENGKFRLKAGQMASFSGIERFTEVYAVEFEPNDIYEYDKTTISVNNAESKEYTYGTKSEVRVMKLNTSISFDFTNYMKTQSLTIDKEVVNGAAGLINPEQAFNFDIIFTQDCLPIESISTTGDVDSILVSDMDSENVSVIHPGGTFSLQHGKSVTIPSVPENMTFTLGEANPDKTNNSFGNPAFETDTCTSTSENTIDEYAFDTPYEWKIKNATDNSIHVVNQQFMELTIAKTGLDGKDIDADETQSTLYEITNEDGFVLGVAIEGNDSITINRLPVATYTIKELVDWSWRYSNDDSVIELTPDEAHETVNFSNTRFIPFWLSGDCHARNWFGQTADN